MECKGTEDILECADNNNANEHTNEGFEDETEASVLPHGQKNDDGAASHDPISHSTLPSKSSALLENLPPDTAAAAAPSTSKASDNPIHDPISSSVILSTALPPVASGYRSLLQPDTASDPEKSERIHHPRPIANSDLVLSISTEDDRKYSASSPEVDSDPAPAFPEAERVGGRCRSDSVCDDAQFRLVSKCGRCHVTSRMNLTTRCLGYARDIFTTVVDLDWKYHFVIWMSSFCLSWIGFGVIWWFTIPEQGYDNQEEPNGTNSSLGGIANAFQAPRSCLKRVHDIAGSILFSIETQSTIGYGSRYINSDCHPLGYILLFVQILCGVCITLFLCGVIFKKLSRPYGRSRTVLFSRYAVIQEHGTGTYRFAFRMGDIRRSHMIGTSIRALMVKDRLTKEGERIPLCQYPLELDTQSSVSDSFIFMPWPIIVSHCIDSSSPMWTMSEKSLKEERFEIIVMFEGVVESTGASTQLRTSFLPSEILWGREFAVLPTAETIDCNGNISRYVDFGDFDRTVPVKMSSRSAKDFAKESTNKINILEASLTTSNATADQKNEFQNTQNIGKEEETRENEIPKQSDRGIIETDRLSHPAFEELIGSNSARLRWKQKRFGAGKHPDVDDDFQISNTHESIDNGVKTQLE